MPRADELATKVFDDPRLNEGDLVPEAVEAHYSGADGVRAACNRAGHRAKHAALEAGKMKRVR